MLYNSQGLLQERFVLVEIPNALYAGFYWTLSQLQKQSESKEPIAFLSSIAPSIAGTSPQVSAPKYTALDGFTFQLNSLRSTRHIDGIHPMTLKPSEILSNEELRDHSVDALCQDTTLDRGQATAMCENLCRGFAFTQGPPGTGKT